MSSDVATAAIPRPVPDRPLTPLDIIDGSFEILRQRPKTVLLILAAFVLPTQFAAALAQREFFSEFNLDVLVNGDILASAPFSPGGPTSFGGGYLALGSTLASSLILPLIGVALTHLVGGWKVGEDRSAAACLLFTLRRSPVVVLAWMLCKLIQSVAVILLVIPFFFAIALLLLVAPVIAAENVGPLRAIRRSVSLVRPRMMPTMGLLLAVFAVGLLLGYPVQMVALGAAFVAGSWGWILLGVLGTIGTMILMALAVGIAVLAYFDLRNRAEGFDILQQVDRLEAARVG